MATLPSITVWQANAYPCEISDFESRSVLLRRTLPSVTWTAQRPQRPCPPQGWPMSMPASCAASASNVLVGTSIVALIFSPVKVTVCCMVSFALSGAAIFWQRRRRVDCNYASTSLGIDTSEKNTRSTRPALRSARRLIQYLFHKRGQIHCLARADADFPICEFLFEFTRKHGNVAR